MIKIKSLNKELKVSDNCLKNLLKIEKDRQFDRLVQSNKSMTIEQCFSQNQRMILNSKNVY